MSVLRASATHDVLIIGGGVVGATLASLLRRAFTALRRLR